MIPIWEGEEGVLAFAQCMYDKRAFSLRLAKRWADGQIYLGLS